MKRDAEGNSLPDSVCFNSNDFENKIRALVDFSTESCSYEKFRDDFLIEIERDDTDGSRRNIRFIGIAKSF